MRDRRAALDAIVRNTLIHEIGHHFGYSDDDMDRIECGQLAARTLILQRSRSEDP